jgi:hypothetical protein
VAVVGLIRWQTVSQIISKSKEMVNVKDVEPGKEAAFSPSGSPPVPPDSALEEGGGEAAATGAAELPSEPPGSDSGGNAVLRFVDENLPELSGATEEEKYAAVAALLEKQKKFNAAMEEVFAREPELATIISGVMRGESSFIKALSGVISPDELSALQEADGEDAVKARDERHARYKEYRDQETKLSANVGKSSENIAQWLEQKGWDDAKKQDFTDKLMVLFSTLKDGVLTADELDQLERMIYFDDALAAARDEGAKQGRNEQIDAKRLEEEANRSTDGLPKLQGGGKGAEEGATPNPLSDVISMNESKRKF